MISVGEIEQSTDKNMKRHKNNDFATNMLKLPLSKSQQNHSSQKSRMTARIKQICGKYESIL